MDDGPNGCKGFASDSGFINSDIFLSWLEHFVNHVRPENERPVLLIMDNHSSHISLEVSLYSRKHHISILTLAPHTSHKIQPLDRSFFGPLKTKYSIECDTWMNQHPGRGINIAQVVKLFNGAFQKVATVGNASSGFAVSGIYPFNEHLFDDGDFAPASVPDRFNKEDEEHQMELEDDEGVAVAIDKIVSTSAENSTPSQTVSSEIAPSQTTPSPTVIFTSCHCCNCQKRFQLKRKKERV